MTAQIGLSARVPSVFRHLFPPRLGVKATPGGQRVYTQLYIYQIRSLAEFTSSHAPVNKKIINNLS
jgi:hypothetical protein